MVPLSKEDKFLLILLMVLFKLMPIQLCTLALNLIALMELCPLELVLLTLARVAHATQTPSTGVLMVNLTWFQTLNQPHPTTANLVVWVSKEMLRHLVVDALLLLLIVCSSLEQVIKCKQMVHLLKILVELLITCKEVQVATSMLTQPIDLIPILLTQTQPFLQKVAMEWVELIVEAVVSSYLMVHSTSQNPK